MVEGAPLCLTYVYVPVTLAFTVIAEQLMPDEPNPPTDNSNKIWTKYIKIAIVTA